MSATDYFRRNCWITTECDDPFVADVIRWIGDDRILYESDFPHPDSKYPRDRRPLPAPAARPHQPRSPSARSCGTTPSTSTASPTGYLPDDRRTPSRQPRRGLSGGAVPGNLRRRHEAVDYAAIERMFPPPPEYFETAWFDPPERDRAPAARPAEGAGADGLRRCPFFRAALGRRRASTPTTCARSTTCGTCRSTRSTTSARASRRTRRSATTRASRPTWRGASRCASTCRAARRGSRARPSTPRGTAQCRR